MTKKPVGILMAVMVGSLLCRSGALADENISEKFARLIKNENYKEAYALIAPQAKTDFTEEQFIQGQKDTRVAILKDSGMNAIKNLERVDIAFSSPFNENTLKQLFSTKPPEGEFFNIFQFVFDNDKIAMFKVDFDSTGIIGYEYSHDLSEALYSGQGSLPYKRVVIE